MKIEMKYKEFVERMLGSSDDLFCPFDGIWCERSSCIECSQMKAKFAELKRNKGGDNDDVE